MAGKGGGAWKVAYADFVTAMMAFFMVMWLVGQKKSVKDAIAQHFQHPPDPFSFFEEAGSPTGPSDETHDKFGGFKRAALVNEDDHPQAKKLKITPARPEPFDSAAAVVTFDEDGVELTEEAKTTLLRFIPGISGKPQKVEIRGHATRKPLPAGSPYADQWSLSYARSDQVRQFLEENGISPHRIRMSQAAGYEPFSNSVEKEALAKNPRVEVFLLGEFIRGS